MPPTSHDILVYPGNTELARELCRLGRAAEHEMTSLSEDGRPEGDAPWHAGVQWVAVEASRRPVPNEHIDHGVRLVYISAGAPEDDDLRPLEKLLDEMADRQAGRLVYATTGHETPDAERTEETRSETVQLVLDRHETLTAGTAVVQLPPVDTTATVVEAAEQEAQTSTCRPLPVGQAAMALLRAAVEPDTTGLLDCRAATKLGYAAMIQ